MSAHRVESPLPAITTSEREIVFPTGLVGCPEWRRFLVEEPEELPGLLLLRCLDEPGIEFVVAPVLELVPDYLATLAPDDARALRALGVGVDDRVHVFATLSVHPDGTVTANLLGPLVLDFGRGCGTQVVVAESGWGTRHPIVTE